MPFDLGADQLREADGEVLGRLDSLLQSISLEAEELAAQAELNERYADQLEDLESQRKEISLFARAQRTKAQSVAANLVSSFRVLLEFSADDLAERNSRIFGLYRSAAATIMPRNWPEDAEVTVAWVDRFNRVIEREIAGVLDNDKGLTKVQKLSYLRTLPIRPELHNADGFQNAPKEYWLQYAAFNLIGTVLNSGRASVQLELEMGPALKIMDLVTAG